MGGKLPKLGKVGANWGRRHQASETSRMISLGGPPLYTLSESGVSDCRRLKRESERLGRYEDVQG